MIEDSGREIRVEVDGRVNGQTGPLLTRAGANVLVSGSYLFAAQDPPRRWRCFGAERNGR
jgi:ribulose-phosphate 3-epimerase